MTANLKSAPVITFHLYAPDKDNLQRVATEKGMQVATLARMIILDYLKKTEDERTKTIR